LNTAPPASASPGWLADFVWLGAIWGSSFLFMRLATVEFGPLPTAALRVAIASVFLLPWVWWRGLSGSLRQHWRKVFLVGMLNSGIPFACYSFALLHISTGLSSILNATVPLFGALIAWVWLKDRPAASRIAGLVIGFVGVLMLASGQSSFKAGASGTASAWAVLACLVATFCYGLAASFTKRHLQGIPPLVTATGSQIGATLGLALPALFWPPAQWPGTTAWLALLAVGVLCTGVAYILYFRLIEHAGPAKALTVTFLVPVFAIAYGVLLLGEQITTTMVGWGAVILLGTGLSSGALDLSRKKG
jgi:drug/metabolite transporter (DMT)-like permease